MDLKRYQLKPGTILDNRYIINDVIGEGGFGITYDAVNQGLNMRVAIKEFFCRDYMGRDAENSKEAILFDLDSKEHFEEEKHRFLKEARILGAFINEPGIVDVTDYFEENGTAYIVMRFLEGVNLREYVEKNGPMEYRELFAKVRPLLETLGKVHDAGLIHGDISPDNIMLLSDGSLCLIDFGASYKYDKESKSYVINVGKSGYTAPEQHSDESLVGPKTDIYSLCATLFYCLTSRNPEASVARMLMNRERVSFLDEADLPKEIEAIIEKGLALKPVNRFLSVEEMKDSIDIALSANEEVLSQSEKKRFLPFIVAIGILFIVIITVRVTGTNLFGSNNEKTSSASESFDFDKVYHVRLTATGDMSVKKFNEALPILEERMKILCGEEYSHLKVDADVIDIQIPKERVRYEDLDDILKQYITGATEIFAFNGDVIDAGLFALEDSKNRILVDREDIEEISIQDGPIEGIDVSDLSSIDPNKYRYIKVVLSDQFVEKNKESLLEWGDNVYFGQDINTYGGWYYYYTYSKGDGKTFYIILDQEGDYYYDLVLYNLTHDAFSQEFNYTINYDSVADWEEPNGSSEYQCDIKDISGDTVTFMVTNHSMSSSYSEGELLDISNGFKSKMDALEQPYAFSTIQTGGNLSVIIKTSIENIGDPIISIMGSNSLFNLQAGLYEYKLNNNTFSLENAKNDESGNILSLKFSANPGYTEEEFKNFIEQIKESGETKIHLTMNNMRILSAAIDSIDEDLTVPFTEACITRRNGLAVIDDILANFVRACWDSNDGSMYNFVIDQIQFEDMSDREMLGYIDPYLAIAKQVVKDIDKEATCFTNGTSELFCAFNLNIDSDLPQKSLDIGKSIFEGVDFINSPYSGITIYLIREDERAGERDRIFFRKRYGGTTEERYIYTHGIYKGGRLGDTKDTMKALLDKDEFYQKYNIITEYETSFWTF